jgi:predicted RNase H-like HicB family nuclease/DNA-binding XRE family transcriptional regulator
MRYAATVVKEKGQFLIEFPDAPGCQTFAESADEIRATAQEALEGWLEANLVAGRAPPRPHQRAAKESKGTIIVHVPSRLAVKLEIRWARHERNLSQEELGDLLGVKQPMIRKLEDPDYNPGVELLERVANALGLHWDMSLHA